jgi:class 3 adenylate cyclase/ligand-binding sensor domain-containing protein
MAMSGLRVLLVHDLPRQIKDAGIIERHNAAIGTSLQMHSHGSAVRVTVPTEIIPHGLHVEVQLTCDPVDAPIRQTVLYPPQLIESDIHGAKIWLVHLKDNITKTPIPSADRHGPGNARAIFPTMLFTRAAWSLAFLAMAVVLSAQQYDLRTWSLEHGLPGATVNAVCEDHRGHLWVGTNEGVARTDGINFQTVGRREGLPNDDVTALHCASNGMVWIGCADGSLIVLSGMRPFILKGHEALRGRIQAIAQDPEGTMWIASGARILKYDREGLHIDDAPGLPRATVNDIIISKGRPVAGTDSGLFVRAGEQWAMVPLQGQAPATILSLHGDDTGVLAGTTYGYLELGPDLQELPLTERFAGTFPIALPDPHITSILRSRDGHIWLGTPSGLSHLSRRAGQPFHRLIREANGLGHDLVLSLHQDRSGAIWCGTGFGGLSRFMSDAFMHFTDRDGLPSRIVSGIHRTPDGHLWLGTMGGGMAMWNGRSLSNFGRDEGLEDVHVLALAEDEEGYLIAGTSSGKVFRWDGRGFQKDTRLSTTGSRVLCLERDPTGRIWVGYEHGVRSGGPGGDLVTYGLDAMVMDLEHAGDTTWLGTSLGLFMFVAGDEVPTRHPLSPRAQILSMARDKAHNLWLGTDGHGLLRINGTRIDSISTDHNSMGGGQRLVSNTVLSVVLDAFQNVWAGTRRGIHELELDVAQEMVLDIRHHGPADGFIGIEVFHNATMLDVDSTIWFGTVRGATRYDHREVRVLQEEPLIAMDGMQLFFEDVDWSRWSRGTTAEGIPLDLRLPHGRNHLTFNFTGISLAAPEQVHYRYILEGHDPDWSPITTTNRVIYSNIPPGGYTFKVMARNASGIWTTDPLAYEFEIIAPIWGRTWFQAGALILLVLLVMAYLRYRDRRARRVQRILEEMVTDRTRELAEEQQRSDSLLLNILPRSTADELMKKGSAHTRSYDNCTVLFSDFTGFTEFSSRMDGHQLVADLDHFFRMFDRITDEFGIEKIKTIGDAYMCASGIPEPKATHALDAVLTALRMIASTQETNITRKEQGLHAWQIRIGIHSGPLVAGVVGEKKFAYDIWGDTVNLASRMESNSDPGMVNISGSTYAQVMEFVEVVPRGPIKVRGKGELHMYFVTRLKPPFSADPEGRVPNERLLRIRQEMLTLQEI